MRLIDLEDFWGRNWAVSKAGAEFIVDTLHARRPLNVLECGSGNSTLLFSEYAKDTGSYVCSLEHEKKYFNRTVSLLEEFSLKDFVDLKLVSLSGKPPWYQVSLSTKFDFILIDGPPGHTRGRTVALPNLWGHLSEDFIVILDDAQRPDEKGALNDWKDNFPIEVDIIDAGNRSMALISPTSI